MHKKLIAISSFILLLVFFSSIASAQTTTGSAQATTNNASKLKEQIRLVREQKKAAVYDIKQDAKEKRVELRQQIKETVQAKREALKEAVATKREEFKAKLETIKDERKKALVERIDAKLENANTKHTDRFTHVLNNLQLILDKIGAAATEPGISKNIAAAQATIDTAKLAVENQAAKTYVITISTEKALRANVGAITSQLRVDLMATHKLVVDAKQAVQTLRKDDVIMKKEATNSANL